MTKKEKKTSGGEGVGEGEEGKQIKKREVKLEDEEDIWKKKGESKEGRGDKYKRKKEGK